MLEELKKDGYRRWHVLYFQQLGPRNNECNELTLEVPQNKIVIVYLLNSYGFLILIFVRLLYCKIKKLLNRSIFSLEIWRVFIQSMPFFKTSNFRYLILFSIINHFNKEHIYCITINLFSLCDMVL